MIDISWAMKHPAENPEKVTYDASPLRNGKDADLVPTDAVLESEDPICQVVNNKFD